MPTRKPGSEWPSMAHETMLKSAQPCCRIAAITPAPVAIKVDSRIAGNWIFSVSSPYTQSRSPTGWL